MLSTQSMVLWMEEAAFNVLLPFCEGDEVSVSTAVKVDHCAATEIGAVVKVEAELESFDGRFYTFKVSAHNGAEVVGQGTIKRAIVSKSKFEEKQRAKQARSS
jgi:fluoroacetyl-CoA thioesterase